MMSNLSFMAYPLIRFTYFNGLYLCLAGSPWHFWMKVNRLIADWVWHKAAALKARTQTDSLNFSFSSSVRDLDITLDSELTFTDHISLLARSCFYHLWNMTQL